MGVVAASGIDTASDGWMRSCPASGRGGVCARAITVSWRFGAAVRSQVVADHAEDATDPRVRGRLRDHARRPAPCGARFADGGEAPSQRLQRGQLAGEVGALLVKAALERHPHAPEDLRRLPEHQRLAERLGQVVVGVDKARHQQGVVESDGVRWGWRLATASRGPTSANNRRARRLRDHERGRPAAASIPAPGAVRRGRGRRGRRRSSTLTLLARQRGCVVRSLVVAVSAHRWCSSCLLAVMFSAGVPVGPRGGGRRR